MRVSDALKTANAWKMALANAAQDSLVKRVITRPALTCALTMAIAASTALASAILITKDRTALSRMIGKDREFRATAIFVAQLNA